MATSGTGIEHSSQPAHLRFHSHFLSQGVLSVAHRMRQGRDKEGFAVSICEEDVSCVVLLFKGSTSVSRIEHSSQPAHLWLHSHFSSQGVLSVAHRLRQGIFEKEVPVSICEEDVSCGVLLFVDDIVVVMYVLYTDDILLENSEGLSL